MKTTIRAYWHYHHSILLLHRENMRLCICDDIARCGLVCRMMIQHIKRQAVKILFSS